MKEVIIKKIKKLHSNGSLSEAIDNDHVRVLNTIVKSAFKSCGFKELISNKQLYRGVCEEIINYYPVFNIFNRVRINELGLVEMHQDKLLYREI